MTHRPAFLLTLFVSGQSAQSQQAAAHLRRICAYLGDECELTIVDVLERPAHAEEMKVIATPTVVRLRPLPSRRVIGDLSDTDGVMRGLGLPPVGADLAAEAEAQ